MLSKTGLRLRSNHLPLLSATLAMIVGILVWFTQYSTSQFIYIQYDDWGLGTKLGTCLLPNMCITWAFRVIQQFEFRSECNK